MIQLPIIKCHGSENDFIMIDEVSHTYPFTEELRAAMSIQLCHRDGALGADGVLFFVPSKRGDGMMRMFNPDGSEAEMCGNGIRCIGRLAHEVLGKEKFMIETLKGLYAMQVEEPLAQGVSTYSVCIDTVSLHPSALPLNSPHYPHISYPIPSISPDRDFTALSLTNPHITAIVPEVRVEELKEVGRKANNSPHTFPEGVNLTYCHLKGERAIYTGTYERGAGITASCGTGMSAATLGCCLNGEMPFGEWIDVYNSGGMVRCKGAQDTAGRLQVSLLGNATYTDHYHITLANNGKFTIQSHETCEAEIQSYRLLKEEYC